MKTKVIAVVGPTASGKSSLAVNIARKFNGEIISADSRQVYKGLDLGTGKITKKEMRDVPHHLLDISNPKKQFSVSEYKTLAKIALQNTVIKNKLPIVCGGTGFYIDTLLRDTSLPEVPPNKKLRAGLFKLSLNQLNGRLTRLDPGRAKTVDVNNKIRIIRAIEIATLLGKVPSLPNKKSPYDVLWIGISPDAEALKKNINKRIEKRLKQGMIAEAKKLHKQGVSWKRMKELGLEYRFLAEYLSGELSRKEFVTNLEIAIWQYAKRQMTWFKRNKKIRWSKTVNMTTLDTQIKKFLN